MPIPVKINSALTFSFVLAGGLIFAVLPICLLPLSGWWALLLVPWIASANTHWSLIHEAVHGHLFRSAALNAAAGRVLSLFFGGPFATLRAAHLMHHRFNGKLVDRPEVYAERPHPIRYYFNLVIGLNLMQMISSLAVLLPESGGAWFLRKLVPGDSPDAREYRSATIGQLYSSPAKWGVHLDGLLVLALLACGFLAYGSWWSLLLGTLLARGFLISFMDNSYHYGLPMHDFFAARNARIWWSGLWLYFPLHGVHHRNPQAPWTELPRLLDSGYDDRLVPMAFRQLKGPLPYASVSPSSSDDLGHTAEWSVGPETA